MAAPEFIKIGHTSFALDRVTLVVDFADKGQFARNMVRVFLGDTDHYTEFEDKLADAFRGFMRERTLDVGVEDEEPEQFRYYREKGGELLYSDWLILYRRHRAYMEKPDSWYDKRENGQAVAELEKRLLF